MSRVTSKDLENIVSRINAAAGAPQETYVNSVAQVGNYHIYGAYGSVAMYRITNEHGGCDSIIGLMTKRELYNCMQAFLKGLES